MCRWSRPARRRREEFWRPARTEFPFARDRMFAARSARCHHGRRLGAQYRRCDSRAGNPACREGVTTGCQPDLTASRSSRRRSRKSRWLRRRKRPTAPEVITAKKEAAESGRAAAPEREGSEEIISAPRAGARCERRSRAHSFDCGSGKSRARIPTDAPQCRLHGARSTGRAMRSSPGIIPGNGARLGEERRDSGQARHLHEPQRRSRGGDREFLQNRRAEMLVVLDDFAFPLGRLRLRTQGSSGGHNGLESVIEHFGTEEIPRLRIGIGAAPGRCESIMCSDDFLKKRNRSWKRPSSARPKR